MGGGFVKTKIKLGFLFFTILKKETIAKTIWLINFKKEIFCLNGSFT